MCYIKAIRLLSRESQPILQNIAYQKLYHSQVYNDHQTKPILP